MRFEIIFISSSDVDGERVTHSKSNNMELMLDNNANEVVNKLFSKGEICLETSVKGSDFIFDPVQQIYCKCHKANFTPGVSYIDSSDWIKKKKQQLIITMKLINCIKKKFKILNFL